MVSAGTIEALTNASSVTASFGIDRRRVGIFSKALRVAKPEPPATGRPDQANNERVESTAPPASTRPNTNRPTDTPTGQANPRWAAR